MSTHGPVVILAGGTGGAKLARGMLDVVGPEALTVIVNTGDDIDIYGAYVSPDPDLVAFWLADRIDVRGWGLEGDTFNVMDGLRELGEDVWFNLGDRDLAISLKRKEALDEGERLTSFHARLLTRLGVGASVLPMCDEPVRTRVLAGGRWWPLQEFLIRCDEKAITDVEFKGAPAARASDEALAAIESAGAIVIGPSNPIISIGPMLALDGFRTAVREASAPVVAVSPIVRGSVLKGPTAECLAWRGAPATCEGVAGVYGDLIDGFVCDEPVNSIPSLRTELLMDGAPGRRRLAEETLRFAMGLAGPQAGQPARSGVHQS